MLLQFTIKNYKTFKDKATLSLIATNYDKDTRKADNIFYNEKFNLRLLKSAVVYGANASGKSKLMDALAFMRYFVINSSKESQQGDKIDVEPFRLSSETENEPTEFEVIFIHNEVMYRYGFEATKEKIISEWLFYKPKTKEIELFYREGDKFDIHEKSFVKGRTVARAGLVRDNALLISVAAQFNDETAIQVIEGFKRLITLSGLNESGYENITRHKTEEPLSKAKIIELLKAADLGIQDIKLERDVNKLPDELPEEVKNLIIKQIKENKAKFISDVLIAHKRYDSAKKPIDSVIFSLEKDESSGTKKFFALTGLILDAIENGYTLVIDELDSKLHPNLVCRMVSLFNSKELNPKNAQLIFNTHDTNLLDSGLFRRDQIWFTDKNNYGEAKLYSLADFKSDEVKKNEPYEENYIRGKYGAVPYLGLFDNLNDILSEYENEKQKS